MLRQHLMETLPLEALERIPGAAGAIPVLRRALAKDREDLLGSARELADRLRSVLEPAPGRRAATPTRPARVLAHRGSSRRLVRAGDGFELLALGEPFKVGEKVIRDKRVIASVTVEAVEPEYATAPAPAALTPVDGGKKESRA